MKYQEIKVPRIFGTDGVHNPNEVNPYVGCLFSCSYCYVAGNENPDDGLRVKINAPQIVRRDIEQLDSSVAIFLSSLTDPYLYAERKYEITRRCIEEIIRHPAFRLSILTKSHLVTRDLDLLRQLDCCVEFSICALQREIQRVVEPFAPSVKKRLEAIEKLERNGTRTSVRIKPVLPFDLSDVVGIVRTVEGLISGSITVQGIDLQTPFVMRMALLAQKHFPDRLFRWLNEPERIREERAELKRFLKGHDRVTYREIDEVVREVRSRFSGTSRAVETRFPNAT